MKLSGEFYENLYTTMVKIRRFDEKVTELFQQGLVKGTAHSYVGQEAVATGACANLRTDDYIVSNHRGHGHTIAKGARIDRMWFKSADAAVGGSGGRSMISPPTGAPARQRAGPPVPSPSADWPPLGRDRPTDFFDQDRTAPARILRRQAVGRPRALPV